MNENKKNNDNNIYIEDKEIYVKDIIKKKIIKKKILKKHIKETINDNTKINIKEIIKIKPSLEKKIRVLKQEKIPIISIIGNVNSGKTTLIERITNNENKILKKEKGGITQRSVGYEVINNKYKFIIIDTPGHNIFNESKKKFLRKSDIIIAIIDSEKEYENESNKKILETIKEISEEKKDNKTILIAAINKIDIDKNRAKAQEIEYKIKKYNSNYLVYKISAIKKTGIKEMLEATYNEFIKRENNNNKFKKENNKGKIITIGALKKKRYQILLIEGIIEIGNQIYKQKEKVIENIGKITQIERKGKKIEYMCGTKVCIISGINDNVKICEDITTTTNIKKEGKKTTNKTKKERRTGIKEIIHKKNNEKKIKIYLISYDLESIEIIKKMVRKEDANKERIISIIKEKIGEINKNDIIYNKKNKSIIICYDIDKEEKEEEDIFIYNTIYRIKNKIKDILKNKNKEDNEKKTITIKTFAKVLKIFKKKDELILGCKVIKGTINRKGIFEIYRKNIRIMNNIRIKSIKILKENIDKVKENEECGIIITRNNNKKGKKKDINKNENLSSIIKTNDIIAEKNEK